MLKISGLEKLEDLQSFFKDEIKERLEAVQRTVLLRLAEQLRDDVKKKLPRTGLIGEYADAIEVAEVTGAANVSVAVRAKLAANLSTSDYTTTLVFFPPATTGPTDPVSKILSDGGGTLGSVPGLWALDQLPPVEVENANVQAGRAPADVEKVRAQNVAGRPAVDKQLRDKAIALSGQFSIRGKALVDVPFLALQVEFGGPGVKQVVAWRPAVTRLTRGIALKKLFSDAKFVRSLQDTLMSPDYKKWKQDSKMPDAKVASTEVLGNDKFSKLVS